MIYYFSPALHKQFLNAFEKAILDGLTYFWPNKILNTTTHHLQVHVNVSVSLSLRVSLSFGYSYTAPIQISEAIQNPNIIYSSPDNLNETSWNAVDNEYLWNISGNSNPTKSIYDPSPAGYQTLDFDAYNYLINQNISTYKWLDDTYNVGGQITMLSKSDQVIYLPALGYRDRNTGHCLYFNQLGNYWSGVFQGSEIKDNVNVWFYYNIYIGPNIDDKINISQVNSTD